MIGLNCGKCLGALSSLMLFTLGSGIVSHYAVSLFSVKIFTRFCKSAHFPSPMSLTSVYYAVFAKTFLILVTAFVIASIVDMKGILVECVKI